MCQYQDDGFLRRRGEKKNGKILQKLKENPERHIFTFT